MTEQLNWTELSFNKKKMKKRKKSATCLISFLSLSFYPVCISKFYVQCPHLRCLTGISELRCLKWNLWFSRTMLCSGFVCLFVLSSVNIIIYSSYSNPLTFTCCSSAKTIFKPLSPVEVSYLFCLLRYHNSLSYQSFLLQDTWLISILALCKPDSILSDFFKI